MSIFTRKLLSQRERFAVPTNLFGVAFPLIESTIYSFTELLAPRYKGGYHLMYKISNGAFYMAVDDLLDWDIACPNDFRGRVTSDALGLIVCLYTFSHLGMTLSGEDAKICAAQFHLVRDYALDHLEKVKIFGAID